MAAHDRTHRPRNRILLSLRPQRTHPRWEFASGGALHATSLLVAGSYGFSVYVSDFATYDKTYGSLGAVVVLLMWFWLGSFSILVGAAFNAELARSAPNPDKRRTSEGPQTIESP